MPGTQNDITTVLLHTHTHTKVRLTPSSLTSKNGVPSGITLTFSGRPNKLILCEP